MDKKKLIIIGGVALLVLVIGGVALTRGRKTVRQVATVTNMISVTPTAIPILPTVTSGGVTTEGPITLTVSTPQTGTTVSSPSVTVKGKTTPKAEVAVNETESVADASGVFSVPVALDEGENIIVVVVNDAEGNVAEQELSVIYEPSQ